MPSYTPRMNTFPPVGAHLIAGDWVTEGAAGTGVSLNPARPDEPVGDYPIGDAGTASDAVGAAVGAADGDGVEVGYQGGQFWPAGHAD
jgi:hypothetical protein